MIEIFIAGAIAIMIPVGAMLWACYWLIRFDIGADPDID